MRQDLFGSRLQTETPWHARVPFLSLGSAGGGPPAIATICHGGIFGRQDCSRGGALRGVNFREMGSIAAPCRGIVGKSLGLSVIAARVRRRLWSSVSGAGLATARSATQMGFTAPHEM